MEAFEKTEAERLAEIERQRRRQQRISQVRQQTNTWLSESRQKYEKEKSRHLKQLIKEVTTEVLADAVKNLEELQQQRDVALQTIGEAHRAAANYPDYQRIKAVKKIENEKKAERRYATAVQKENQAKVQEKENSTRLQRIRKSIRAEEDLKSKFLVERRPFRLKNVENKPETVRTKLRKQGYEQSLAKSLHVPGAQNSKSKKRKQKSPSHKLKKQPTTKEKTIIPGIFASVAEVRAKETSTSPKHSRLSKPRRQKRKSTDHSRQVKPKSPDDVVFVNAKIPLPPQKYKPPVGLVVAVPYDPSAPSAWDRAKVLVKEQKEANQASADTRAAKLKKTKERGDKALKIARLEQRYKELATELMTIEEEDEKDVSGIGEAILPPSDFELRIKSGYEQLIAASVAQMKSLMGEDEEMETNEEDEAVDSYPTFQQITNTNTPWRVPSKQQLQQQQQQPVIILHGPQKVPSSEKQSPNVYDKGEEKEIENFHQYIDNLMMPEGEMKSMIGENLENETLDAFDTDENYPNSPPITAYPNSPPITAYPNSPPITAVSYSSRKPNELQPPVVVLEGLHKAPPLEKRLPEIHTQMNRTPISEQKETLDQSKKTIQQISTKGSEISSGTKYNVNLLAEAQMKSLMGEDEEMDDEFEIEIAGSNPNSRPITAVRYSPSHKLNEEPPFVVLEGPRKAYHLPSVKLISKVNVKSTAKEKLEKQKKESRKSSTETSEKTIRHYITKLLNMRPESVVALQNSKSSTSIGSSSIGGGSSSNSSIVVLHSSAFSSITSSKSSHSSDSFNGPFLPIQSTELKERFIRSFDQNFITSTPMSISDKTTSKEQEELGISNNERNNEINNESSTSSNNFPGEVKVNIIYESNSENSGISRAHSEESLRQLLAGLCLRQENCMSSSPPKTHESQESRGSSRSSGSPIPPLSPLIAKIREKAKSSVPIPIPIPIVTESNSSNDDGKTNSNNIGIPTTEMKRNENMSPLVFDDFVISNSPLGGIPTRGEEIPRILGQVVSQWSQISIQRPHWLDDGLVDDVEDEGESNENFEISAPVESDSK